MSIRVAAQSHAPADDRTARARLLETADRLFYAEGVQSVGINRIIDEAGVAKRSLYTNFGSKDALIQAYLKHRHDGTASRLTAAIAAVDDPREKILAVFDVQARTFSEPGFHGCAFMEASAEAEPGSVIDQAAAEFRGWIRTMFTDLAKGVGAARRPSRASSTPCTTEASSRPGWTTTPPSPPTPARRPPRS